MDPSPQTAEAIEEFGPFVVDGEDLLDRLLEMGARCARSSPSAWA